MTGEIPDPPAPTKVRFGPIADRINTGILAVLVLLHGANQYVPEFGAPALTTVFLYLAGVAIAVTFAAYGIDAGVLPTLGEGEEVGE